MTTIGDPTVDHTDVRAQLDVADAALQDAWQLLRDRGLNVTAYDLHKVRLALADARDRRSLQRVTA